MQRLAEPIDTKHSDILPYVFHKLMSSSFVINDRVMIFLRENIEQKEMKIQVSMSRTRSAAVRPVRTVHPHLHQVLRHDVHLGWSMIL
jgi:D-tyrosyl-tRNA(Tyr) deacylase